MQKNLLILGGTTEASALAQIISKISINARLSYAGRVASRLRPSPIKKRVGGFGGVSGLVEYLKLEKITHVIDATHLFASQMSKNAIEAHFGGHTSGCAHRPPGKKEIGDKWINVPNVEAAVQYLEIPKKRILLAIGRQSLSLFYAQPQHKYICD